jgi:rSAM/selenodomain-associated transferase 1
VSDRTLVVFVKEPRPGAVKTRLAADVGPEAAAELYRALAEAVLEATTPVPGEYERLVFFDPPEARRALREWLPGVSLRAQARGELGERMADAFARAFGRGAVRVAIVGSDAPGVTRATALRALEALGEADVVLGPAEDGGYYLIGLRAPHPELVRDILWSTPAVMRQTLERATAAGLVVRRLEPLRDVDTLADLRSEWPALEARLGARPELRRSLARALGLPVPG